MRFQKGFGLIVTMLQVSCARFANKIFFLVFCYSPLVRNGYEFSHIKFALISNLETLLCGSSLELCRTIRWNSYGLQNIYILYEIFILGTVKWNILSAWQNKNARSKRMHIHIFQWNKVEKCWKIRFKSLHDFSKHNFRVVRFDRYIDTIQNIVESKFNCNNELEPKLPIKKHLTFWSGQEHSTNMYTYV